MKSLLRVSDKPKRMISVFLALFCLTLSFSGCTKQDDTMNVSVSCLNANGSSALKTEIRSIPVLENEALYRRLVEELQKQPEADGLAPVLTYQETLNHILYSNHILTLVFSKELKYEPPQRQTLILGALTATFCNLPGIDGISVFAESSHLHMGVLTELDFINNTDSLRICDYELLLYFPNEERTALETALCAVRLSADANLALAVMETLLGGAVMDSGYEIKFIPEGTRIHSVHVDDGLCTVDLSSEFLSSNIADDEGVSLTVYAIVNSLTSLSGIASVQFLIDGEAVTSPYCDNFQLPITSKGAYLKSDTNS